MVVMKGPLTIELASSLLSKATYNYPFGILTLEFVSGKVYEYKDVPITVFTELILAASAGQYFHANIKDKFEYKEVKDDVQTTDGETTLNDK